MELAGLGDNVHLLPALHRLNRHWPQAELHVMANAHVAPLFTLAPWVRRIHAYPVRPKPGLAGNWRLGAELRRERFDLVFNSNGSDRSSVLTWLTRAPRRIGRRPFDGGPIGWSTIYTEVVSTPFHTEPMYVQKLRLLPQFGVPVDASDFAQPDFGVQVDPELRRAAGVDAADDGSYVHVSPFTTAAARELPLAQLAAVLDALRVERPDRRLALSCADTEREKAGLARLAGLLATPPWKQWPGTLGIPALASVIAGAALNLSGDTGSLHVALMTGTRALAWFRAHRGQDEWIPRRPGYAVEVAAADGPTDALYGLDTAGLVHLASTLLIRPS